MARWNQATPGWTHSGRREAPVYRPVLLAAFFALTAPAPAASRPTTVSTRCRSHADFGVSPAVAANHQRALHLIAGELKLDPHGLATIDARITADSIVMDSDRLRRWVLAPEFFDAVQYPTIRFLSDPITFRHADQRRCTGRQLSLRGVTQPVRFELLSAHCARSPSRPA
jgi:polyisoprenoid-binding protein YceI